MNISDLQGKKIAVLGYGVEGKSTVRFLHSRGLYCAIFDQHSLMSLFFVGLDIWKLSKILMLFLDHQGSV
jgi:hypothetical protein